MNNNEEDELDDIVNQLQKKFEDFEENLKQRFDSFNTQIDDIEKTIDDLIKEFGPQES